MEFRQSSKLSEVCYEIRGPVIEHANALEEAGHSVLRLNTGNPALFGFEAPEEIVQDMIRMLPKAHGYTDSRGILSARRAVAQRYQSMGLPDVDVDDIYLGNGVSELISMAVQALLEDGDEVLVPAPDYPLWTAVVTLAGGKPVHYLCDESADWYPDLDDMASKITDRTKAVVVINPNNPTGAVYPKEVLEGIFELARRHGLMVLADEIYDQIVYDDVVHHPAASSPRTWSSSPSADCPRPTGSRASAPAGWSSPDPSSTRGTTWRASPCWPPCGSAPTPPPSTPSRPRSAAGSPSTN